MLAAEAGAFACTQGGCAKRFPIIDGRPILIDDETSVFAIEDFVAGDETLGTSPSPRDASPRLRHRLRAVSRAVVPSVSYSVSDFTAEAAIAAVESATPELAQVLVLGAGDAAYPSSGTSTIVYSDVVIRPLTHLIADAHGIPFADKSFDAVIANAVLEHVADPYRCVEEIHRVLKPNGLVYAVTPFMQQVHLGRYDFTRFTPLDYRRLFRHFEEVRSGISNGPAMAFAWSFVYMLAAASDHHRVRGILQDIGRFLVVPFKYLDARLARTRGAYDAASATYFFGRKSDTALSDREIVRQYRGAGS